MFFSYIYSLTHVFNCLYLVYQNSNISTVLLHGNEKTKINLGPKNTNKIIQLCRLLFPREECTTKAWSHAVGKNIRTEK